MYAIPLAASSVGSLCAGSCVDCAEQVIADSGQRGAGEVDIRLALFEDLIILSNMDPRLRTRVPRTNNSSRSRKLPVRDLSYRLSPWGGIHSGEKRLGFHDTRLFSTCETLVTC